jgi:peptidoglycan/LPS O-acetylase OafA/YrhL
MKRGSVIEWGVKAVTFLFAMFGGFLTSIAPPEESNSRFAVGLASFLALVVLLIISALVRHPLTKKARLRWMVAACALFVLALAAALAYRWNLDRLTFPYPPESTRAEYVAGTRLTPEAQKYVDEHPDKTISTVVADFGIENRELVWPPDALREARLLLLFNYVALVLAMAGAIFSLSESVLSKSK